MIRANTSWNVARLRFCEKPTQVMDLSKCIKAPTPWSPFGLGAISSESELPKISVGNPYKSSSLGASEQP